MGAIEWKLKWKINWYARTESDERNSSKGKNCSGAGGGRALGRGRNPALGPGGVQSARGPCVELWRGGRRNDRYRGAGSPGLPSLHPRHGFPIRRDVRIDRAAGTTERNPCRAGEVPAHARKTGRAPRPKIVDHRSEQVLRAAQGRAAQSEAR